LRHYRIIVTHYRFWIGQVAAIAAVLAFMLRGVRG